MKWHSALFQWLVKIMGVLVGMIFFIDGTIYYLDGGYLIVNNAIPIEGLWSCIRVPMGILFFIGTLYFVTLTEKELEEN